MYKRLLDEGVINSTFGTEVFNGDGYFTVIFSGESSDPAKVRDALIEETDRMLREGIDEKDFERIRKSTYGMLIRELNNVEAVANLLINAHMDGVGPYDTISVLSHMTSKDVLDFMKEEMVREHMVMSVIEGEAD